MARPIKDGCDYFSHDAGMRNHRKVNAIRNKFLNGYAIWNMLLEYLTARDGNEFEYSDEEFEDMAGDFRFSVEEIKGVVDYAIYREMLFNKNGFIYSESLNDRLEPVYLKRGKARDISRKQSRSNGKFTINNAVPPGFLISEMPQSKVNESKVNEPTILAGEPPKPPVNTIEKREKKFADDLTTYLEKYGKGMIRQFFDYWREPNKSKSRMRFEREPTWDLNLRLQRWAANDKIKPGTGTVIQLSGSGNSVAEKRANDILNQADNHGSN